MNQTVTVNISGIVFHIEVDAYDTLKTYLNKIKSCFHNSEEREEIMMDIESRIAELFSNMMDDKNQVIVMHNVEEVISIMGKPEEYLTDEDEENVPPHTEERKFRSDKKLFRDPDDRVLGGVASGIASYLGIDRIWPRLFFVLSFLIWGFGPLAYIILWIIIPEAKTASDKLKMKGEPVNVDNIGKTFEAEAKKVNDKLKTVNTSKLGEHLETFFNGLAQVIRAILKILSDFIGFAFIAIGVFLAIGFIAGLSGSDMIIAVTSGGIFSVESSDFFNLIFVSEDQFHLAVFGVILLIGIPIITIIYGGVKILFKIKTHNSIGIALTVFWLVGIAICSLIGMKMGKEMSSGEKIAETKILPSHYSTFNLVAQTDEIPGKGILDGQFSSISLDDENIYWNDVKLDIHKSKTDSIEIKVYKYAHGESKKAAKYKAKSIQYHYHVMDSTLHFNNFLSSLKENKIRAQEVSIHLYLPVGKSIYLDPSIHEIIYDIDNTSNTLDSHMLGKKWVMLPSGLTCLDCKDVEGISTEELSNMLTSLNNELEHKEPMIK